MSDDATKIIPDIQGISHDTTQALMETFILIRKSKLNKLYGIVTLVLVSGFGLTWITAWGAAKAEIRTEAAKEATDEIHRLLVDARSSDKELTAILKGWKTGHVVTDIQVIEAVADGSTTVPTGNTATSGRGYAHFPTPVDFVAVKSIGSDMHQIYYFDIARTSETDFAVTFTRHPDFKSNSWTPKLTLIGVKINKT